MSEHQMHNGAALRHPAIFSGLAPQPADALLALIALHRADTRADKIDLGVGVYKDASGATPVMQAVKAAEARLAAEQPTKAYLGAEGDARFTALLCELVLGDHAHSPRLTGVQTPGGTGALRLGAELVARAGKDRRVWLSDPSWPNHRPIFTEAGLQTVLHPYYDPVTGGIRFDEMLQSLSQADAGDVLLLHGCCHNPTGTQFSLEQWKTITGLCNMRGILPFVDLAYHGLADGLEADTVGLRFLMSNVPEALVAYSCDKNFGLYRERVGALWAQTATPAAAGIVRENLFSLSRSIWSMPPDHGAAVVRVILDDRELARDWIAELDEVRTRLAHIRAALAKAHPRLAPVGEQRGMFSLLPISAETVLSLREGQGIYMAGNGRINVAGLNADTLPRFADTLTACLG